jgi:hypothetical protein
MEKFSVTVDKGANKVYITARLSEEASIVVLCTQQEMEYLINSFNAQNKG